MGLSHQQGRGSICIPFSHSQMHCTSNAFSSFSAFPHNGQNTGLSPFLGTLNTGGSLPDLTNLHYSAPLPASLDTSDHLFGSMSVGNSVGNLPAAMTHLGIRTSSGE